MKGVSKKIIEIVDTDNESVEKILIFLKPGVKNVRVSHQKTEAEKYVSGLVFYSKLPFFKSSKFASLCIIGGVAVSACGALLWMI